MIKTTSDNQTSCVQQLRGEPDAAAGKNCPNQKEDDDGDAEGQQRKQQFVVVIIGADSTKTNASLQSGGGACAQQHCDTNQHDKEEHLLSTESAAADCDAIDNQKTSAGANCDTANRQQTSSWQRLGAAFRRQLCSWTSAATCRRDFNICLARGAAKEEEGRGEQAEANKPNCSIVVDKSGKSSLVCWADSKQTNSHCKLCHCLSLGDSGGGSTGAPAAAYLNLDAGSGGQNKRLLPLRKDANNSAKQQATSKQVFGAAQFAQTSINVEGVESKRERKAAKTLAIITGVFVMCWLPFFIMAITMPLLNLNPHKYLFAFLLWLGYVNSMLNPIIYTIFSPDFRLAFTRLLCGSKTAQQSATSAQTKSNNINSVHAASHLVGGSSSSASLLERTRRHFEPILSRLTTFCSREIGGKQQQTGNRILGGGGRPAVSQNEEDFSRSNDGNRNNGRTNLNTNAFRGSTSTFEQQQLQLEAAQEVDEETRRSDNISGAKTIDTTNNQAASLERLAPQSQANRRQIPAGRLTASIANDF